MAHTPDSETTPACTAPTGVLATDRYPLFAAAFDAMVTLPQVHSKDRLQLHGGEAGAAFRAWAGHHGLMVEATTLTRTLIGGGTVAWTMLSMISPTITVHLDEYPVAISPS